MGMDTKARISMNTAIKVNIVVNNVVICKTTTQAIHQKPEGIDKRNLVKLKVSITLMMSTCKQLKQQ